jgi:transketolase
VGDLIGVGGGDAATFVPPSEVARLLAAAGPRDEVVRAFATACRLNTLGMVQLAGSGHLGSSFSSLDLVSWLHLEHLGPDDVYFSSKGHDVPGLYSVLIALGRLPWEMAVRLRRLGGLPGHPDVGTPGIPFNTGSLGMGISKAKGLIAADRLAGRDRRVVVMTGDGELQEGQVWESLASAVRDRLDRLTVVVDHNRLQSDLPLTRVSDLGDLDARFAASGWDVVRVDGHDLAAIAAAFDPASRTTGVPRVIVAETIKGAGVSFLEPDARPADERFYPFHSGALAPEAYAAARDELAARLEASAAALGVVPLVLAPLDRTDVPVWASAVTPDSARPQRLVDAYARALAGIGGTHPEVVVLDADLMVDMGLVPFRDAHPERFLECGIAEQDMLSQAGGLAAGGMLPIVHSFATFLSSRPTEQVVNNASEARRVIHVGGLAGLLPAAPGHSHQGLRDLAAFDSVEGVVVVHPSSERQVAEALADAVARPDSTYLRLSSVPVDLPHDPAPLPPIGTGAVVHAGSGDTVAIAYGPVMLAELVRAVASDAALAARVTVVDLPWLNRVDDAWLAGLLAGARRLVVVDDHDVRIGLGVRLAARCAELGLAVTVERHGVDGPPACGSPAEVLAHHGLDHRALAASLAAGR